MKLAIVHRCASPRDGEFRRVSLVSRVVAAATEALLTKEVALQWWHRFASHELWPDAVPHASRIELPIIMPTCRLTLGRAAGHSIQRGAGLALGMRYKPDVILGETHGSWPCVSGIKRAAPEARVIMDLHGAFPEEIDYIYPDQPWPRSNVRYWNRVEADLCRRSDLIICQSEEMRKHIEGKHGQLGSPIVPFRCAADLSHFHSSDADRDVARREFGISTNELVVVYIGTFLKWQLPQEMFRLFAELKAVTAIPTRFLVIAPVDTQTVRRYTAEAGLSPRDVIHTTVPAERAAWALSAADVGLLLRDDSVVNRVASPNKLAEYLACGLPIITSPVARYWPGVGNRPECFLSADPSNPVAPVGWHGLVTRIERNRRSITTQCRSVARSFYSQTLDAETVAEHVRVLCQGLPVATARC